MPMFGIKSAMTLPEHLSVDLSGLLCHGYSGNPKSLLGNSPVLLGTKSSLWSLAGSQDPGAYT